MTTNTMPINTRISKKLNTALMKKAKEKDLKKAEYIRQILRKAVGLE